MVAGQRRRCTAWRDTATPEAVGEPRRIGFSRGDCICTTASLCLQVGSSVQLPRLLPEHPDQLFFGLEVLLKLKTMSCDTTCGNAEVRSCFASFCVSFCVLAGVACGRRKKSVYKSLCFASISANGHQPEKLLSWYARLCSCSVMQDFLNGAGLPLQIAGSAFLMQVQQFDVIASLCFNFQEN
jgi:hypothetical protein